ncbi:MAG TPA: hypothetical protein DD633_00800 [Sphaerochaeta sp.]|nr:hypothetical protein [Sphaerochaeta sp.]
MRYMELLAQKKPTLIMSLPENNPEFAKIAFDNGADVVKVHVNLHHHASQHQFATFEQECDKLVRILSNAKGPCGIVAGQDVEQVRKIYLDIVDLGFEFISLYAHHTPLELLRCDKIKKMIAFDNTYDLGDLRYLAQIGADVFEASVMAPDTYGQPLSSRELVTYKRICKNTGLPVVIPTQRKIRPDEMEQLMDCGISGIMIGAMVTGLLGESIGAAVAAFRKAIDRL